MTISILFFAKFRDISGAIHQSFATRKGQQERITQATEQIKSQNLVAADDAIQRLQASLPELFCCRILGDGFGAVINAVLLSLQNTEGGGWNEKQIDAIGRALRSVRNEPFLFVRVRVASDREN